MGASPQGRTWVATVTSEGKLRMDDGREYATPTAAARAVGGSSAGLTVWKRTSNGQKLSDVLEGVSSAQALRTPNDQMVSLNQPDSINRIQPVNARPAIRRRVWCDWRCWFGKYVADAVADRAFAEKQP